MDEQFRFHFGEGAEGFIRALNQLAGSEDRIAAGLTEVNGIYLDADGDTPMCLNCNSDQGVPMCLMQAFKQLLVLLYESQVVKQNLQARILENFVHKGNADWQSLAKLRASFDAIL